MEDTIGDTILSASHHYFSIAESKRHPYYLCLVNEIDQTNISYFAREDAEFFEKAAALLRALPEQ